MPSTSCLCFATCRTQSNSPSLPETFLNFQAFHAMILDHSCCTETCNLSFSWVADIGRDVLLWRGKKISLMVVFIPTATWVLMEVCQFNFTTVVSWVGMAFFTSFFLWANMCRCLGKEPRRLPELEIAEESTTETTNFLRESIEEAVRWMLRVGAESELYAFAGAVADLWVLSTLGSCMDLLTLVYIGIMMSINSFIMKDNLEKF